MALSSTVGMVAWNSRRSSRTRPAGLFDAGWARFVRHGEHPYTPRRRARWQQGPQARLSGYTARSEADPSLQDQLRSLPVHPRVENSTSASATRVPI
jgi:hypothetical protein